MDLLSEVEKKLDLPPAEKVQVMRELRSHYCELRDEFVESGMDAVQAGQEAEKRLGEPGDIAFRLQTVHCRATWKTALLTALPFLWSLIVMESGLLAGILGKGITQSFLLCFGLVIIAGSIRELVQGRRPTWLATWLAVGIYSIFYLPYYFVWMPIFLAPLMMAVALGVFARHPYGSTTQASLFLFAYYGHIYPSVIIMTHGLWIMLTLMLFPTVIAIATVLIYSRAAAWRHKLMTLAIGIFASGTLPSVLRHGITVSQTEQGFNVILSAVPEAISTFIVMMWVILVPLLFQRFRPGGDRLVAC